MDGFMRALASVWTDSGFASLTWENIVMILVGLVLLYLAIAKEYEPLLLLPIAFGDIMANFPNTGFETDMGVMMAIGFGIKYEIFPPLIFMGVGAMTDFGPLIANPKTVLLGAAAQIGVFVALAGAMMLGFNVQEAASIGIIGGADGPTAIYLTTKLAPHLLGAIAVAAYSYMSLVPLIQPPIMKLCTTKAQRSIKMVNLRPVTHFEKVAFPIVVAIVVSLLLPPVAALMGCLCLGNLFEVSGVTARLSDTAQNALCNIVTIFLATGTGLTMTGDKFLRLQTIEIIVLGLIAFAAGTAGGVLFGQIMRIASGNKVNPLIGSAGVSAVPMAARVSQVVGLKDNPSNYLLMQAMGPNVAGVIGTAVAAGTMLAQFGG
ncbi:sodium ion-translocating decarboxylase subunit beta [uncultured Dialister sp.]|jgi:sodium ion-translocating decarboxylase beta subunit|uniref:sodium ion-translocating decarboxylase subunit beta n=1 Tax=uncultured Dialister sp. TaxID=278064 RepID=UPI00265E1EC1|nr:sodium ion-translocating decarboxylase subunit beta [uncultured Dialister sp.]